MKKTNKKTRLSNKAITVVRKNRTTGLGSPHRSYSGIRSLENYYRACLLYRFEVWDAPKKLATYAYFYTKVVPYTNIGDNLLNIWKVYKIWEGMKYARAQYKDKKYGEYYESEYKYAQERFQKFGGYGFNGRLGEL